MKYKITGLIACAVIVVAVIIAPHFAESGEIERYHQHIEAEVKAACDHSDDIFCTHLPLVQIETGGKDIPGELILNEDEDIEGITFSEEGLDYITGDLYITDNYGINNHTEDKPQLASRINIGIRGNSSRRFDKKGYSIRLVDEAGFNNPQSVIGMAPHHEWVLHGPYLDKTLIRNYMWYNIAGEIMEYAPNVRFCEVMIDGQYEGVYLMSETITAGDGSSRLNLTVNKKDNTFTGYLLRLDRGSSNELKNLNTLSMYTKIINTVLNIEYPGSSNLTEEIKRSIELDFSKFEKALYSFDYESDEYGYEKYIDVENFVDYLIINEVSCNYDAGSLSTYIYKDIDGKFKLSVWDFNNCCDNFQESVWDERDIRFHAAAWFNMMLRSDEFTDECVKRYRELRKGILSDEYINSYIDNTLEYLGEAVDRNNQRWSKSFEHMLLKPVERNIGSHEEAVEQYRNFIMDRTEWLDKNIESIKQYSSEARNKKYNEGVE